MSTPSISFILPKRPEEAVDKTIDLVVSACKKNRVRFEIIVSEGNHPTFQRNDSVKYAKFDYIYFIDNDSEVSTQSVKALIDFLNAQEKKSMAVDALGGPTLLISNATPMMKNIDAVLSSRLAVGKVAARYSAIGDIRESDEGELILCNLVVKHSVFKNLKSFKKKLYPGEEVDFIMRLLRKKKKVFYHPQVVVSRPQRSSLKDFVRQMYSYGVGRAELTRINFRNFSFLFLLPAFLMAIVFLAGMGVFFLYGFFALLNYLAIFPSLYFVYMLAIVIDAKRRKKKFSLGIFPCIATCHFFFPLGILMGFTYSGLAADKKKISYNIVCLRGKMLVSRMAIKKSLAKLSKPNKPNKPNKPKGRKKIA